jgi:hypothetical protein
MRRPTPPPIPLFEQESRVLERALRGVHRGLRVLLGSLPVEAQTASGLARFLRVERTTCQRAVSAAMQPYEGVSLASQLPGVEGLRLLAEAARTRPQVEPQIERAVGAITRAIDTYDAAIRQVSGSRSKLLARISAGSAPPLARMDEAGLREALFTAAAELTGRHSQTWLAVHIYEPTDNPERVVQTRAHGLIGHTARPDAVPLTLHVFGTESSAVADPALNRFVPLIADQEGGHPTGILRAFSTQPPPVVESRQPNEFMVQLVEPDIEQPEPNRSDLVFGLKGLVVHPGRVPPYLEEVWALVNFPVRHLLLDVFLERELARACIPSLDVHLWRPDFASTVGERWQTRFATGPKLQVLGGDITQFGSEAHARHAELLRYLFESRALRSSDYVGFRCELTYPIWRTGYRMSFDFGRDGLR